MVVIPPKPVQWIISEEWKGETAFILGGGPSVKQLNLELLQGRRVVALNSSYLTYPKADILFFGDARWWNHQRQKNRVALDAFAGRIVTCSGAVRGHRLLGLRRINPPPGFAEERHAVASQQTNMQGAMNMCAHLGVSRIVLLGADMGRAPDGSSHHHDPHPWPNAEGNVCWDRQMDQLKLIAAPLAERKIEVINCSLASRIDWWPKQPLEGII